MIDDPIIHMPKPARIVASLVLLCGAIGFIVFAYYFSKQSGSSDEVLIAMSLVQLLLTGFAFLLIFGFSQRSLTFEALNTKTSFYLANEIPNTIRKIHFQKPIPIKSGSTISNNELEVKVGHCEGDYRADYWIYINKGQADSRALLIDLNLNVRKALLVIKLPINHSNQNEARTLIDNWIIPSPFSFMRDKEPKEVEHDTFLASSALHIYLSADFDEKFLVTPSERLLCAQAITIIVRDLFVLTRDMNFELSKELNEPADN